MAIYVATGTSAPGITFNGTNLSDHLRSVEVKQDVADVDVTPLGATSQQHAAGLRDDRITATFFNDFAASSVEQTIFPFVGSSTGATIVVYANGTTATTTAPKYTMIGNPFTWSPIAIGGPGEASMVTVEFVPAAGTATQIIRATS